MCPGGWTGSPSGVHWRKCLRAQLGGAGAQPACLLISVPVPGSASPLTVLPSLTLQQQLHRNLLCLLLGEYPPPPLGFHKPASQGHLPESRQKCSLFYLRFSSTLVTLTAFPLHDSTIFMVLSSLTNSLPVAGADSSALPVPRSHEGHDVLRLEFPSCPQGLAFPLTSVAQQQPI